MPKASRESLEPRNKSSFYRHVNKKKKELLSNINVSNSVSSTEVFAGENNVSPSISPSPHSSVNSNSPRAFDILDAFNENCSELLVSNNPTALVQMKDNDNNCDVLDNQASNVCAPFQASVVSISNDANINSEIASWAVSNKISHLAIGNLLKILKPYHPLLLPSDPRTLLHTPRVIETKSIEPGSYYHIGIQNGLQYLLSHRKNKTSFKNSDTVEVIINIDGLPLSKSSSSQLYPILMCLFSEVNVSLVGVYHGYDKPKKSNEFLRDFVDEAIELSQQGFNFGESFFKFRIKGFVCDAPAKSFVKSIKGHTGYFSCSKCMQEGEYVNNRICFPDLEFILRTDDDFLSQRQEEHHVGLTILQEIPNFGLISGFPLDYMHLICLGVVKKLIVSLWLNGKPPYKLSARKIELISEQLVLQSCNIPKEFCRKPRGLNEAKRWKATEFRQFLLYTGVVVLCRILPKNYYINFVALHLATSILCNKKSNKTEIDYAASLLKYFVQSFKLLYGKDQMSHNVHNLLHIKEDVQNFGCLDNFSAFYFENYLQSFFHLLKKPNSPISQIIKRIAEKEAVQINASNYKPDILPQKKAHNDGPLIDGCSNPQFTYYSFGDSILTSKHPNNCCALKNKNIVIVKNFATHLGNIVIIGKKFLTLKNIYDEPCPSSRFNMYEVSDLNNTLEFWPIDQVVHKFVKLATSDENTFAVLPLLHSEK